MARPLKAKRPGLSRGPFGLCWMVEGEGFEPSKAVPSDLQSDPFDRSGIPPRDTGRGLYTGRRVSQAPAASRTNIPTRDASAEETRASVATGGAIIEESRAIAAETRAIFQPTRAIFQPTRANAGEHGEIIGENAAWAGRPGAGFRRYLPNFKACRRKCAESLLWPAPGG